MNNLKKSRDDLNTICKTFFCMVRLTGGNSNACLDLADRILQSNFEYLTEVEMTSIIYSITKLSYSKEEEIDFE